MINAMIFKEKGFELDPSILKSALKFEEFVDIYKVIYILYYTIYIFILGMLQMNFGVSKHYIFIDYIKYILYKKKKLK